MNTPVEGATGPTSPGRLPRVLLALAVAYLPARSRTRYRQELSADLYGLSHRRQLWEAITVLAHCGALRSAQTPRDLPSDVLNNRRPVLCYVHHRLRTAISPEGVPYRTCTRCGEDHYDGRGDNNLTGNVISAIISNTPSQ